MRLKGVKVGFALTGSHCTLDEVLVEMKRVADEGAILYPIISAAVDETDTRFGASDRWKSQIMEITGQKIIKSIVGAEPFGPEKTLDVLVVAPCTGNTLAKLANAITDGPVLMAIKAHLRNQRPVVLAVSTNDGLSMNAKNIGLLLNCKNIYMVPFGQDNPAGKPNSLKAQISKLVDTIEHALQGRQIQPVLVAYE
ncbi:dipicolinate synthase subunit B [Desulfoscipio geothermicus]|uniref:Dipicolinate synthase subunit B n=1 Tax=Desulfoscipio geothermicus DSM 3669 TaxID=1121426 RepID=A0A1I6D8X5_9FIRM|nr:dipicolinate synthase subunit B [Desulfoscipio geothermicus]SFR01807.1 dipicolinate synthase subunit B [Desulfoscipio geothermicus DSM 3669]